MKSLILSDIHMGSRLFKHEDFILDLLYKEQYKEIILCGDIIDVLEKPYNKILCEHFELISRINLLTETTKVVLVVGNHDPTYSILCSLFPHCYIMEKYSSDNIPNTIFIHGHKYAHFMNEHPILSDIVFRITKFFSIFGFNIREFLRELFFILIHGGNIKMHMELILQNEINAIKAYKELYSNIVMGHTHIPKIYNYSSVMNPKYYINCGDWVYNYTYVIYNHEIDKFTLNYYQGN